MLSVVSQKKLSTLLGIIFKLNKALPKHEQVTVKEIDHIYKKTLKYRTFIEYKKRKYEKLKIKQQTPATSKQIE